MIKTGKNVVAGSNNLGEVYILLHVGCELKCKVCPYWGIRGACRDDKFKKKYTGYMDLDAVKRFIDQVSEYNPRTITLSGGEPLLFDQWVEIAEYVRKKGLKLALSTNALHLAEYYSEIFKYVGNVHVSLGGTKDIICKVREAGFGFDEVMQSLAELSRRKKSLNRMRPYVRLIYVVSDLSYDKIKEFYDLFRRKEIGIDEFYFQHFIYIDERTLERQKKIFKRKGFSTHLWEGFLYKPKRIIYDKLFQQMDYLSRFDNVTFSPKMTREEIKKYYSPSRKRLIKQRGICSAPWNQVDLYPNGDIMICPDYVIGNINDLPFSEIWNGKKARQLRKYIMEKKRFPGCTSCFYYYVSIEDTDHV